MSRIPPKPPCTTSANARVKKYHQTPNGILALKAAAVNSAAAARDAEGKIGLSDLLSLWLRQMGMKITEVNCAVCGTLAPYFIDHVVECSDGGANTPDNLQMLCAKCHAGKTYGHRIHRRDSAMRVKKFAAVQKLNKKPAAQDEPKKRVKAIRLLKRQR